MDSHFSVHLRCILFCRSKDYLLSSVDLVPNFFLTMHSIISSLFKILGTDKELDVSFIKEVHQLI